MKYRKGCGDDLLSVLGYGCMRFTKKNGTIDLDKAETELRKAIDGGVNYFDTAYIYPGNEVALGHILKRIGGREQLFLATKLPQYLIKSTTAPERYFKEQCKRLQTNYIDYYLMHMLTDIASWNKLKSLGITHWIEEKKKQGQIRHIGFSYHGNTDMFLRILEAYPWDFCQIQYNYMDEHSQAGRRGLEAATKQGIPVIIMEPLRGGSLARNLPQQALEYLVQNGQGKSAAELALRWLWDQPEVTCVLSGMNTLKTVEENIITAQDATPHCLSAEENLLIEKIKAIIKQNTLVSCTGCSYCMPCPQGVDIPGAFHSYNITASENKRTARKEYLRNTLIRKNPSGASQCVGCGLCTAHCPQGISIPNELKKAKKVLETPLYPIAKQALKLFHPWE